MWTTRAPKDRGRDGVDRIPVEKETSMNILKGIRPLDYVLTAVMVGLAIVLAVMNMTVETSDLAHPLDSQSALMIPVFVLAALPILWRREHVLTALGISVAVVASSVPAFGWVTRCGFALPLAVAFAYAVARFGGGARNQLVGLTGVLLLEVVTLVQDASTGGLGGLVIGVPAAAIAYGAGVLVERGAATRTSAPTLSGERVNV
jgi:hypothetical protein